ncbi:hypothetical protein [Cellulomonas sp.]|uniref:hypothetical protein n=1 Tax=Cellulomonas sp. TaxID=40001 RepID=UPI002811BDD0|nr:hypothetical protein [Cellulomonas sp.]
MRIVREGLEEWPALRRAGLAGSYGVLSFDVPGADHACGAEAAAARLALAMGESALDRATWHVLARIGPVDTANTLLARRLERDGPWWLPGAAALPSSPRRHWWLDRHPGGAPWVYGLIHLVPRSLVGALVSTRTTDAVVVETTDPVAEAGDLRTTAHEDVLLFDDAAALLRGGVQAVARAYGRFDDPSSGVDVVAPSPLLDRWERAARRLTV